MRQRKVVAITNDGSRPDQQGKSEEKEPTCPDARSFPLFQADPPQAAEDDDASHVERPTGKLVSAHLCFAHRVEKKLEIPGRAGQGAEQIVRQHGHSDQMLLCCVRFGHEKRGPLFEIYFH